MEEKLIEFVRNNKFLYHKNSRHYKNICLRDEKFEELAREINVPAKKLKDRWRTLRDKFYKELKRENLSSGSGATIQRKQWKWMDQLIFLKDAGNNTSMSTSGNCSVNWRTTESSTSNSSSLPEVILPNSATDDVLFEFTDTNPSTPISSIQSRIDDMLLQAKQDLSQVVIQAKKVFAQPVQINATQKFFDFLAQQTQDANLSSAEFCELQMELLKAFNKVVHKT